MEQCAIARVRVPQLCDMPPPSDDQEKLMFNNSKFDARGLLLPLANQKMEGKLVSRGSTSRNFKLRKRIALAAAVL